MQGQGDTEIAVIAERQHGTIAHRQLVTLVGLGDGAIGYRLRSGRLHRLHRGVYAVGHRRLSQMGRWTAAVLACGEGAVLSHVDAAALHGLRGAGAGRTHVTVPTGAGIRQTLWAFDVCASGARALGAVSPIHSHTGSLRHGHGAIGESRSRTQT